MPAEYKDAYRARIGALIDSMRLDYTELSRLLGRNDSYIQQFLKKGSPRILDQEARDQLAPMLQCSPEDLLPAEGELRPLKRLHLVTQDTGRNHGSLPIKRTPLAQGPRDLPVRGGADGASGKIKLWGEARQMAPRPGNLMGVDQAYAVFHVGDDMSPRYRGGETLHLNPNKPLSAGCFVLISLPDNTAIAREYLGQSEEGMRVRQLNPPLEVTIPHSQITRADRIVGTAED